MSSTIIDIPNKEVEVSPTQTKKFQFPLFSSVCSIIEKVSKDYDMRKVIHSIKVGMALVLVSLLYLLDPLFSKVGENAMWAIMTVVVVFEFYAGATLSKGLNRGTGTIIGGGLGCLVAVLADEIGGRIGNAIVVSTSVFMFGVAATYARMVPKIKRRYDYGVMIFILTFNLVVVTGVRADKVMELARERLSTIGMGFAVCIFISLLIFPIWASDELHDSTANKFEKLACCIEGCFEIYFSIATENDKQTGVNVNSCKSVLHSKSTEESQANFAKWEPWHGKFGLSHPWEKYLRIGEVLRDLAATILSLKGCVESPRQPSSDLRMRIKEPCEIVGLTLVWTLRELGESIMKMKKCRGKVIIAPKLQSMKLELSQVMSLTNFRSEENGEGLALASFVFLLFEMVEKVEELAIEVEDLGEIAEFHSK